MIAPGRTSLAQESCNKAQKQAYFSPHSQVEIGLEEFQRQESTDYTQRQCAGHQRQTPLDKYPNRVDTAASSIPAITGPQSSFSARNVPTIAPTAMQKTRIGWRFRK